MLTKEEIEEENLENEIARVCEEITRSIKDIARISGISEDMAGQVRYELKVNTAEELVKKYPGSIQGFPWPKGVPRRLQALQNLMRIPELRLELAQKLFSDFNYSTAEQVLDDYKESSQTRDKLGNALELTSERALEHSLRYLSNLTSVSGIGIDTAVKLHNTFGYTTVGELIENFRAADLDLMSDKERKKKHQSFPGLSRFMVGLMYYRHFEQKIPRTEVAEIAKIVSDEAKKICAGIQWEIVGSYRRGVDECGDVDILFFPPEGDQKNNIGWVLPELVDKLRKDEFFAEDIISDVTRGGKIAKRTFQGICKLTNSGNSRESFHRRIDLKTFQREHKPFALLANTGSWKFVLSVNNVAREKGLKLNHTGLCARTKDDQQDLKSCIPCSSEEEIFTALQISYVSPENRVDELGKLVVRTAASAPSAPAATVEKRKRSPEEEIFKALEIRTAASAPSAPAATVEKRKSIRHVKTSSDESKKKRKPLFDSSSDEPKKKRKPLFDTSSDDYLGGRKIQEKVLPLKKTRKRLTVVHRTYTLRTPFRIRRKK
jgi:DNA polymerase/3'-5' exonuclease PolX